MDLIKESKLNKSQRQSMKLIAFFAILFGLIYMASQLIFFNKLLSLIGILPIVLGIYLKNRIVRIVAIENDRICLMLNNKMIDVKKNDVISVAKAVRFTATEKFWMIMTFYRQGKKKKDRYFFMNESGYSFLDQFKKMGIPLKNMP